MEAKGIGGKCTCGQTEFESYLTIANMSKVPISIETLLQKQKEEKEAASKVLFQPINTIQSHTDHQSLFSQPKFLTKEERAKIAIEKRKLEIQQEKEKAEKAKAHREALNGETSREAEDFRSSNRARERDAREYDSRGPRCMCLVFNNY